MQDARVVNGADPIKEQLWGIQGPGLSGREEWKNEFSLANFMFLFEEEVKRRGIKSPQLIVRYPYLVGGKPELLPGIDELQGSYATARSSSRPRMRSTMALATTVRRSVRSIPTRADSTWLARRLARVSRSSVAVITGATISIALSPKAMVAMLGS